MCIIRVCQHQKKTAYGYKWEYFYEDIDIINKNENMIKQWNDNQINIKNEHLNLITYLS